MNDFDDYQNANEVGDFTENIPLQDVKSLEDAAGDANASAADPYDPPPQDESAEAAEHDQTLSVRASGSAEQIAVKTNDPSELDGATRMTREFFEALFSRPTSVLEAEDIPRRTALRDLPRTDTAEANLEVLRSAGDPVVDALLSLPTVMSADEVGELLKTEPRVVADKDWFTPVDGKFAPNQVASFLAGLLPEPMYDPNGMVNATRLQLGAGLIADGGLSSGFSAIGEVMSNMSETWRDGATIQEWIARAAAESPPDVQARFWEYATNATAASISSLHVASWFDLTPGLPEGLKTDAFDNPFKDFEGQPDKVHASTFMANAGWLISSTFNGNFETYFGEGTEARRAFDMLNKIVSLGTKNGLGLYLFDETGGFVNPELETVLRNTSVNMINTGKALVEAAIASGKLSGEDLAQANAVAEQLENRADNLENDGDQPRVVADDTAQRRVVPAEEPQPGNNQAAKPIPEQVREMRVKLANAAVELGLAVDQTKVDLQAVANGEMTPAEFKTKIEARLREANTSVVDTQARVKTLMDAVMALGTDLNVLNEAIRSGDFNATMKAAADMVEKAIPDGPMKEWFKKILANRFVQGFLGVTALGILFDAGVDLCDLIEHDSIKTFCKAAKKGNDSGNTSDCSGLPTRSLPAEQQALEAILASIVATYYVFENRATLSPVKPPKWSLQGSYTVSRSMLQGGLLADLPDVLDTLLSQYVEVSSTMQNQGMGEVLKEFSQIPGMTFGPVAGGFAPPSWNVKIDTNNPSVSCYTDPGLGTVSYAVARNYNSCICHRVIGTISVKTAKGVWVPIGDGTFRVPAKNKIVAVRWQMSQPVDLFDVKQKNSSGWLFSPANLVISNIVTGVTQYGKNMQMQCPWANGTSGPVTPTFTWTITPLENYKEWFLSVTGDVLVKLPTTQVGIVHFQIANGAFLKPGAGDNGWKSLGPAPGLPKLIPPWLLTGKYALCALNGDKEPCSGPTLPTLALALGVVLLIGGYVYFKQKKGKK